MTKLAVRHVFLGYLRGYLNELYPVTFYVSGRLCKMLTSSCLVENNGIEPMTSALQGRRSPN